MGRLINYNELKGDQEGEEPITIKNDCEHCAKTYGTLGCCSTVSNEWVYSCKEGHEEYARGMRKFGTTTKNNLGVDCISRKQAIEEADKLCLETGYDNEKVIEMLEDLPPATPQEPKTGHWITRPNIYGVAFCSECGFELKIDDTNYCPYCGCRMVEPQESEVKNGGNNT